ncbi:MAG: hypothetical protein OXP75_06170 [Rhodospirillales bacterium]|nr:hypothetical protein [Rhodospirillales bacterium]
MVDETRHLRDKLLDETRIIRDRAGFGLALVANDAHPHCSQGHLPFPRRAAEKTNWTVCSRNSDEQGVRFESRDA